MAWRLIHLSFTYNKGVSWKKVKRYRLRIIGIIKRGLILPVTGKLPWRRQGKTGRGFYGCETNLNPCEKGVIMPASLLGNFINKAGEFLPSCCKTCRFSISVSDPQNLRRFLECREGPPIAVMVPVQGGIGAMYRFPIADESAGFWCHRFEPKPELRGDV